MANTTTSTEKRAEQLDKLHDKIRMLEAERNAAPTMRGVLQWIRGQGYTISSALLELLDNSLSAKSSRIRVSMYADYKNLNRIAIIDNGKGMLRDELNQAFVVAGDPRERKDGDIGKFRVGMKGATWSLATNVTIVTWSPDGSGLVGLRADLTLMQSSNTFQPTEFGTVDEAWIRGHFVEKDAAHFLTARKGTMIQINNFWTDRIQRFDEAVQKIKQAIQTGYSSRVGNSHIEIQSGDKDPLEISNQDMFHHADAATALEFPPYETVLRIYQPENRGQGFRVVEYCQEGRMFRGGRVAKGGYYEYFAMEKGVKFWNSFTPITSEHVANMSDELLGEIPIRIIQTKASVDEDERETNPNRKGFWFFREIRCVGQGLNLGKKLHDRATTCTERQRLSAVFPAALDDIFGSKFNKQMESNTALPSQVLTDALFSIYKQVTNEWTKKTPVEMETPDDGDESDTSSTNEKVAIVYGRELVDNTPANAVSSVVVPVISEVPAGVDEVPDVVEEIPPTVEEFPAVVEEVPAAVEEVPAAVEEVPNPVTEDIVVVDGNIRIGNSVIPGYGSADDLVRWLKAHRREAPDQFNLTVSFLSA